VRAHPQVRPGQRWRCALPQHANLLEHANSARYHFAIFENTLLNVDGAA